MIVDNLRVHHAKKVKECEREIQDRNNEGKIQDAGIEGGIGLGKMYGEYKGKDRICESEI